MPQEGDHKIPVKIKKPKPKAVFKSFMVRYMGTIMYTMVFGLISGLYTMVFSDASYSVRLYMYTQLGVFTLGIVHAWLAPKLISWIDRRASLSTLIFLFILCMVGFTVILISQKTESIPDIPTKYSWTLLAFALPTVWAMAYEVLVSIPPKEFKSWVYPYGKEIPVVEVLDPIKVNFYIEKEVNDDHYTELQLNVPPKYKIGDFMHYFIHRYNYDKNPKEPIFFSEKNGQEGLYHWVFRKKPKSNQNKHVLDPDRSFDEQNLKTGAKIIVERYILDAHAPVKEEQVIFETDETQKDE